ncbi:MAG TPA: multiheme c-type cytochrome [Candidatus Saccharimonadales bacterium]|nr:multiheme c-type cytochrome [Candidatus Saccharimonadales bacterium]
MIPLKDISHLLRMAVVFLLGLALFLLLRSSFIPKSFGRYGHFRGDALGEITARPIAYAGHQTCEGCHPEEADTKSKGVHAHVNCEACHGPLAKHAEDPASITPQLPDVAQLCVRCHSENIAKPQGFPQVNAKEHSGGQLCDTCHQPHSPGLSQGARK